MNKKDLEFMRGFACAVCTLISMSNETGLAASVIEEGGFTVDDFEDVEPCDYTTIRETLEREKSS